MRERDVQEMRMPRGSRSLEGERRGKMGIKRSGFRAEEGRDFWRGIGYCETCACSAIDKKSLWNNIKGN